MPINTCNILGTLTDSAGVARNATLTVKLDAPIFEDATIPDTIILPAPVTFTITAGVIDFDLPVSELSQTAYLFQLTVLESSPGADDSFYTEFRASIPDQTQVELASLMPSTFTTDRAVTGALRIAKELAGSVTLRNNITDGLGIINSATAPTLGGVGKVWLDSTTGWAWTWDDQQEKWMSPIQESAADAIDLESSTTILNSVPNPLNQESIKLEAVVVSFNVQSAPNDAENRWTLQPGYRLASSSNLVSVGSAYATNDPSYSLGTVGRVVYPVDQIFSLNLLEIFGLVATKIGSPGILNATATFRYRFYA